MKYGIGQKVRVKDFKELAKKYGVQSNGDIYIGDYSFEREMKVYCGEEYRILNHFEGDLYELSLKDGGYWYFHSEVLEDVKPIILSVDIAPNNDMGTGIKGDKEPIIEAKPKRTYTRRK